MRAYLDRQPTLQLEWLSFGVSAVKQCMKSKVKSNAQFSIKWSKHDCAWLLQQIRAVTLQFDNKKDAFMSLLDARANFLNGKQGENQSTDEYLAENESVD